MTNDACVLGCLWSAQTTFRTRWISARLEKKVVTFLRKLRTTRACLPADQFVRDEIKKFSNWPTIPQCYVGGEFVGGSDILLELYESGELQDMLTKAGIKDTAQ
jgi:glutaredoxin-related protein